MLEYKGATMKKRVIPVIQEFGLIPLFVIKQTGKEMYWACSSDHGCGWNEGNPKQAFTQSELQKEIRRLIGNNWFVDCEIKQLSIRE